MESHNIHVRELPSPGGSVEDGWPGDILLTL